MVSITCQYFNAYWVLRVTFYMTPTDDYGEPDRTTAGAGKHLDG